MQYTCPAHAGNNTCRVLFLPKEFQVVHPVQSHAQSWLGSHCCSGPNTCLAQESLLAKRVTCAHHRSLYAYMRLSTYAIALALYCPKKMSEIIMFCGNHANVKTHSNRHDSGNVRQLLHLGTGKQQGTHDIQGSRRHTRSELNSNVA